MNANSNSAPPRRRRTQPRRLVPATIERRERKPIAFGWGADLTDRERESLKERIALVAGIVLAVVIAGLLGWGLLYDNVVRPSQLAAENNKPIAIIGTSNPYVVRMGFFKALERYNNANDTTTIEQLQSQLAQLQASPKKNALSIQQVSQQITAYQQNLQNLPQSTLNSIITAVTVVRRASDAGIKITPTVRRTAYTQLVKSMGGPRPFSTFLKQSGLTRDQILLLNLGDYVRNNLLAPKLAKEVKPVQTKVRASHILVKTRAQAEKLLRRIRQGANFAALAKKYSTDTGSKVKGGDLGYFARGSMVPAFDKAAFSMKPGQIRIVHSRFGFHVLKVTDRRQVRLTPTELQQAQQNALPQWLQQQQTILRVQNIVSTKALPLVATPNPAVLQPASTTGSTGLPGVTGPTGKPITVTKIKKPIQSKGSRPSTGPATGKGGSSGTTKKP